MDPEWWENVPEAEMKQNSCHHFGVSSSRNHLIFHFWFPLPEACSLFDRAAGISADTYRAVPSAEMGPMLYIYCLISNIFWLDVTILPIFFFHILQPPFYCRFYLCLYFLIQLVQWAILLTEIANKLIMTESFCKGDIFMGSIIYGLLATTLIWESPAAGLWLIIGQFASYP